MEWAPLCSGRPPTSSHIQAAIPPTPAVTQKSTRDRGKLTRVPRGAVPCPCPGKLHAVELRSIYGVEIPSSRLSVYTRSLRLSSTADPCGSPFRRIRESGRFGKSGLRSLRDEVVETQAVKSRSRIWSIMFCFDVIQNGTGNYRCTLSQKWNVSGW